MDTQMPSLIFGESKAIETKCFNSFVDLYLEHVDGFQDLSYVGKKEDFFTKLMALDINGFAIAASVFTKNKGKGFRPFSDTISMAIIFTKHAKCDTKTKSLDIVESSTCILFPEETFYSNTPTNISSVIMSFSAKKLISIANGMLGESEDHFIDFNLSRIEEIPLHYYDVNFDVMFRQLFHTLDIYLDNEALLSHLRMDEQFYRVIAMLLRPDLFFTHKEETKTSPNAIKKIENYVENFPYEVITMSDLERITGLSARSIQKLFKKHKNITPIAYIRKTRLKLARILLASKPYESIGSIAMSVGFTSASKFSHYYKKEFGMSPRESMQF